MPALLDIYRSVHNRRIFATRFQTLHNRVKSALYQDKEIKVLSGPFRGLKYINEIIWGSITSKWLGSYEFELQPIVEEICAKDYRVIIDVGCAEGYYAVGLAYRNPRAHVFAYDSDFISRRQTGRLAKLNNLESTVHVSGYCTGAEIESRAQSKTLVVCDIEGYERALLDPLSCPTLARVDLLVEIHEGNWTPETLDLLKSRFSPTHSIQEIVSTDRQDWTRAALDEINPALSPELLSEAAAEHRDSDQKWLWMETKEIQAH